MKALEILLESEESEPTKLRPFSFKTTILHCTCFSCLIFFLPFISSSKEGNFHLKVLNKFTNSNTRYLSHIR